MKKKVFLALIITSLFLLTGCNNEAKKDNQNNDDNNKQQINNSDNNDSKQQTNNNEDQKGKLIGTWVRDEKPDMYVKYTFTNTTFTADYRYKVLTFPEYKFDGTEVYASYTGDDGLTEVYNFKISLKSSNKFVITNGFSQEETGKTYIRQ